MPTAADPHAGMLSLCLFIASTTRNHTLLKETLAELGDTCTEPQGKWALNNVQLDLQKTSQDWLKGHLLKMYNGGSMPYTAHLWQSAKTETISLKQVATVRLNDAEFGMLDAIARQKGVSRSELTRTISLQWLQDEQDHGS